MNTDFKGLITKTNELNNVYKPEILDIKLPADKQRFEQIAASGFLSLHDEIDGQLRELMKMKNPKVRIKPDEYPAFIEKHLDGRERWTYGLWVYYPWSAKLVHILPKDEFIDLRTAANRNKITTAERDILADKKIGVIGLSVGQSVALTIAMERGCGELRLADFDTLELNNLNRLRAGLHNLGLRKVYVVAREIAEIDPFLNIVCYTEGVTEENINGFFTDGGKLDVVIDECDGVDVKILCRIKAKELQVPVVMEASDRGTLDVERFDLHPDRPIMHGWLQHLEIDFNVLKTLKTAEEKLPYILPISGLDTLSPRMKASMIEIEETITSWPQLASAVAMGGAVVADTCRRMFLNQYTDSGRYFIDLEKFIPEPQEEQKHEIELEPAIGDDEMDTIISGIEIGNTADGRIALSNEEIKKIVEAAIAAPTGGNAQPWKWRYKTGVLYLFSNHEYETKLVDFNHSASFIGYGTATENLVLKAHELGYEVVIDKQKAETTKLVATYVFYAKNTNVQNIQPHVVDDLSAAIFERGANRTLAPRVTIEKARLDILVKAAQSIPDAELNFVEDEEHLKVVSDIIAKADRLRILHEGGHLDFLAEMVWTEEEAKTTRRGIDINTLDLSASEKIGFSMVKDINVIKQLNKWQGGKGLEKVSYRSAISASAVGLITVPEFKLETFFDGGRALERVWLSATANNIAFQPLSISTFLFNRLRFEGDKAFTPAIATELKAMREDFEKVFAISKNRADILLFRVFVTETKAKRSEKMLVDDVLSF
ncbi:MAG: Rv1355c family protein [Sphingobacteriales bacterium]|nr:MAG: Rv1355c family protein [Sphingobacteriales bacterium]